MYYRAVIHYGHIGKSKSYQSVVPIIAFDGNMAYTKARNLPAVKHVDEVNECSREEFLEAMFIRIEDPFAENLSRWIVGNLIIALTDYLTEVENEGVESELVI